MWFLIPDNKYNISMAPAYFLVDFNHSKWLKTTGTGLCVKRFWRRDVSLGLRVPEEGFDLLRKHGAAESIVQWSGRAAVPFIATYRFLIRNSHHAGQWTNCLMIADDNNLLIFVISALKQSSHSTEQMDHWSNIGFFRWQLYYRVCLSHWHLGNSVPKWIQMI